jgi:Na+/proline symporter/signal transduction histidine kinase
MVSAWLLSILAVGYLAMLFAVAFYGERHSIYPGRAALRPYIYSLALGVYCTTWTFFGAVGTAATDGWAYLPIYLGPVLVWLFASRFLEQLVFVARAHKITSIAELIASRFGKSSMLGALVTVIALTAAVPYVALQYKAVATSIDVMTGMRAVHVPWFQDTALAVALLMALFAVLFGTRRLDATEHHEGVMLAIAFESCVKLLAFVAVGVFAMLHLDGAPALATTSLGHVDGGFTGNFAVSSLLAACAIFCLPRQFQVCVIECADPTDLRYARWVFPAYLAIFAAFVVPVVLAGTTLGLGQRHSPDAFMLTLPLEQGATWLAVLVFLGGLSAASAMVIVVSIALSTMMTNNLLMPALWRLRSFDVGTDAGLGGAILWLRRAAIALLAALAYTYYRHTNAPTSLAAIGLLAFAAVAQFAPAIVVTLYWRGATHAGVFWGLVAGYAVWTYCLLLPNIATGDHIGTSLLANGPWGVAWLRPQALFGIEVMSPPMRGAFWALSANVCVLGAVSWARAATLQDRMAAKQFVTAIRSGQGKPMAGARVGELVGIAGRVVGVAAAQHALADYCRSIGRTVVPKPGETADVGLVQHVERLLAAAIGASSARLILQHALRGKGLAVDEVAELLDVTSNELRFSRQLLLATMENVSQGIAVADADLRVVAWNPRYLEMFQYPDGKVYVGCPVADLIRWNAERGECGPGDPEHHVHKRIAHMQAGSSYVIQRPRSDGRVFEIRGQPMPDGGYVTTYTDITDFKQTEQALREAKQNLEQRVEDRTRELQRALTAEQLAKQLAQEANASKTRFVAAANHDLLQPLNAARLFASALEVQADRPELKEVASRIEGCMRAAEELLDGMLDVARLDSGALRPEVTAFPIAEIMLDLERQFAPLAAQRGLVLNVVSCSLRVRSDRMLLRRVLQNLMANALRYTQRGRIVVGCRRRPTGIELQVWDTGPGIPEQHQQVIFGEFQRLERPSPWDEKGLGLGLSICDRVGRLLGHALGVRSWPGRGSVFTVQLPRAEGTAPVASPVLAETPTPGPARLEGLTVLCIDNEQSILDGMQALLSRWGIRVLTAQHSADAMAQFARHPAAVVLADYHLGENTDGLDLLRQLGAGRAGAVPGALITADNSPGLAERARAAGYAVLRKPLKPASLRALLGAITSVRTAPAARLQAPPQSA